MLPNIAQVGDKAARSIGLQRSPSLRYRLRFRHVFLAVVFVVFYFYVSTHTDKIPFHQSPIRYKIQADFPTESATSRALRLERRDKVKEQFKHAWKGYKDHAWLHDEVMPVSGGQKDPFVGWAATLVDSLDTLYIMGMEDEFAEALDALEKIDFSKPKADKVPVFEVTIRYLGGLLGAWDISEHKHPVLLRKATQLGQFLSKVFDTPSGLPVPYYWWKENTPAKLAGVDNVIIAQIASLSLEFIRLSQVAHDLSYAAHIQAVTDQLEATQNNTLLPGMWPIQANCTGTHLTFQDGSFSLGVLAGKIVPCLSG